MNNILYHYYLEDPRKENIHIDGSYRLLSHRGKTGINMTSTNGHIILPKHNLNDNAGSIDLWVMSLEDLASASHNNEWFGIHNPHYPNYLLLADTPVTGDFEGAVFALNWASIWYPQMSAKFYRGNIYDNAYRPVHHAIVTAGHLPLHRLSWYHIALTWDKKANDYRLYANGILIGISDRYVKQMLWENCGEFLYSGNPTLVISDITFYDKVLDKKEVYEHFKFQEGSALPEATEEIHKIYCNEHLEQFFWNPDDTWENRLSLPLTQENDLNQFYIQGNTSAPQITPDGLLVETDSFEASCHPKYAIDTSQVYLWSKQSFEGDLHLEYEFMPLQNGGLSLLAVNASGMQREDFMKDYPLCINGSMQMLCWEDVRSYHWEYFREVTDTRNDTASHVLLKNPWLFPLQYRCMKESLEIGKWHKLQYHQEGRQITCSIDSVVVLQTEDNPFNNNGPCFQCGHFAIRCMIDTKMRFRNLKVYNKIPSYDIVG